MLFKYSGEMASKQSASRRRELKLKVVDIAIAERDMLHIYPDGMNSELVSMSIIEFVSPS